MSNPKDRNGYDSVRGAALTIRELERWLARWITGVYHRRLHGATDVVPAIRFAQGLETMGVEPRQPSDPTKLRLDFMPRYERSIGREGISLDNVRYWSDVLRPWVESRDPQNRTKKRAFVVRRDPRGISAIWFWDATTLAYHRIPYRDLSHPATNVWEMREARRRAREQGAGRVTERELFAAREELWAEAASAVRKTRSARRNAERRSLQLDRPATEADAEVTTTVDSAEITPFEEIEDIQ